MTQFSRRQFLRWLGIQLAALGLADFLAACEGRMVEMPPLALKATEQSAPTATRVQNTPADTVASPTSPAETGPTQEPEATATSTNTATHEPPTSTSTTRTTSNGDENLSACKHGDGHLATTADEHAAADRHPNAHALGNLLLGRGSQEWGSSGIGAGCHAVHRRHEQVRQLGR
jgi:cytoskeletal protein RodZ